VQQWIPAMPDVQQKLQKGAGVADVGCGRGRAVIKLAQAFPNSRYVGYDVLGRRGARTGECEGSGVGNGLPLNSSTPPIGFQSGTTS